MKPTQDNNFGRVFELPTQYPEGFCFGGGKPVQMQMVDWFNPWPDDVMVENPPETWEEVVDMLRPFLMQKNYVKPGRRYILVTDFGESLIFGHAARRPNDRIHPLEVKMDVVIDGVHFIPKPRIRPGQTFAQALKTARKNSGETLEQVATAVGTTKGHMWTLERGDCEPRLNLIKSLLKHYGLRFEDVCA